MATTLPFDTTKANFDAGTDDPKQARAEFATNADIQNTLKDALGDFAQLSNPAGSGFEVVARGGGTADDIRVAHIHERKTSTYLGAAADRGKLLEFDSGSGLSLTLTAALTLGDGWFVFVNNSGAGTLTINPDAAELIDDAATITLAQNESTIIISDGAAFWTVGKTASAAAGGLESGTVAVFHQELAPADWTKNTTTLNNAAMRIVTSTAWSSGLKGATAFDSVFGSGKTTGSASPGFSSHSHPQRRWTSGAGGGFTFVGNEDSASASTANMPSTGNTSTGSSHSHTRALDLNYVNMILATKD